MSAFTVAALLIGCLLGTQIVSPGGTDRRVYAQVSAQKPSSKKTAPKSGRRLPDRLVPSNPRTAEDRRRIKAAAFYMTGQLKESRKDFRGAYESYLRAVDLNPNSARIYGALMPLAFDLGHIKQAIKFSRKAMELDPSDYRVPLRMGLYWKQRGNVPKAIELLERAMQSKRMPKESLNYVVLMRELGVLYLATGQKEKAADAFEVLLDARIDPDKYGLDFRMRRRLEFGREMNFERIGQLFLETKRYALAVKAYEQAAKSRNGKPGSLTYNLARVYFESEKTEYALKELQKYFDAQLQSKGRAAYQLLADILKKMNKSDELVGRLEAMAEKDARNVALQYFLADQYLAKDRFKDAEALYKKSLEGSSSVEGYIGLASIYRRQGRAEDLLNALKRTLGGSRDRKQFLQNLKRLDTELTAVRKDKKLLETLMALGHKQVEEGNAKLGFAGSIILANLAASAERTDDAIVFYRAALSLRRSRAGVILKDLGLHLLRVGRHAESAKVFREAADDPALGNEKPEFLFRLSQAREFNGETKLALEAIQEARKLLPDSALLHFQEGWVYSHARQWEKAIAIFETVIAKYPRAQSVVHDCEMSLSNIYVQQGNMRKGEEVLERVLKRNPDNIRVNNDLGYLYADQGKNLKKAEAMIRKALKAEPENAAYLDSMGWVLYKLGKFNEASEFLEKAVKQPSGSDATIWDHLGDCYMKLKQPDKAAENWKTALDEAKKRTSPNKKLVEQLEDKLKDKIIGNEIPKAEKPKSE